MLVSVRVVLGELAVQETRVVLSALGQTHDAAISLQLVQSVGLAIFIVGDLAVFKHLGPVCVVARVVEVDHEAGQLGLQGG